MPDDGSREWLVDPVFEARAREISSGSKARSSSTGITRSPASGSSTSTPTSASWRDDRGVLGPRRASSWVRGWRRAGVPRRSGVASRRGGRDQFDGDGTRRRRVRARIHHGDLLALDLLKGYDLVYGLDIFEHLNPNHLDAYIDRLALISSDDAFLFCNIPVFGADPVFGTVFPFYVDGWAATPGKRPFSAIHADERAIRFTDISLGGRSWWVAQLRAPGSRAMWTSSGRFTRSRRRLHEKSSSPARRAYFVFAKARAAGRRPGDSGEDRERAVDGDCRKETLRCLQAVRLTSLNGRDRARRHLPRRRGRSLRGTASSRCRCLNRARNLRLRPVLHSVPPT